MNILAIHFTILGLELIDTTDRFYGRSTTIL